MYTNNELVRMFSRALLNGTVQFSRNNDMKTFIICLMAQNKIISIELGAGKMQAWLAGIVTQASELEGFSYFIPLAGKILLF